MDAQSSDQDKGCNKKKEQWKGVKTKIEMKPEQRHTKVMVSLLINIVFLNQISGDHSMEMALWFRFVHSGCFVF